MIVLTRINGSGFWLNPLLIESVERTPDTIVTLTNGHKYVVVDSPEEIAERAAASLRKIGILGLTGVAHGKGEDV